MTLVIVRYGNIIKIKKYNQSIKVINCYIKVWSIQVIQLY